MFSFFKSTPSTYYCGMEPDSDSNSPLLPKYYDEGVDFDELDEGEEESKKKVDDISASNFNSISMPLWGAILVIIGSVFVFGIVCCAVVFLAKKCLENRRFEQFNQDAIDLDVDGTGMAFGGGKFDKRTKKKLRNVLKKILKSRGPSIVGYDASTEFSSIVEPLVIPRVFTNGGGYRNLERHGTTKAIKNHQLWKNIHTDKQYYMTVLLNAGIWRRRSAEKVNAWSFSIEDDLEKVELDDIEPNGTVDSDLEIIQRSDVFHYDIDLSEQNRVGRALIPLRGLKTIYYSEPFIREDSDNYAYGELRYKRENFQAPKSDWTITHKNKDNVEQILHSEPSHLLQRQRDGNGSKWVKPDDEWLSDFFSEEDWKKFVDEVLDLGSSSASVSKDSSSSFSAPTRYGALEEDNNDSENDNWRRILLHHDYRVLAKVDFVEVV